MTRQFFGKYEGTVEQNIDPENRGRIQVSVRSVLGDGTLAWALPCMPFAGIQSGIYVVPALKSKVWVEFEGGNPNSPIWVGGFWGIGETPSLALLPPQPVMHIMLQTQRQNAIHISDSPDPLTGGIVLRSTTGRAMIVVNETHILITNGTASIELIGPGVKINQNALTVDLP